jgi:uncharacterized membrane protein YjjP (DUF1212 family)
MLDKLKKNKEYSYTSRKFVASMASCLFLFLAMFICGLYPAMQPMYTTFVGGVVSLITVYIGGNVLNKKVINDVRKQEIKEEENKEEGTEG